jgi:multisubunit Na+/H+ antiporter MnhG subunit
MVRNILGLGAIIIAGIGVAAIIGMISDPSINSRLPSKATIETSLYTALTFFAVAMQFRNGWRSWHFWTIFVLLLVVHTAAYAYALRQVPDTPQLVLLGVAMMEATGLCMLLDKVGFDPYPQ